MALVDLAKSLLFNHNTVNAILSGKKSGWHVDSHFRRKPKSPLPQQPEETKRSEWTGDASKPVTSVDQRILALKKTEIRSSNAILKLWSKLRPRRHTKKRLEPETRGSIASARNRRNVDKTMSARSQRRLRDSTPVKKLATPRFGGKNFGQKMPTVTYDYDAAVSQPDVPNFLDLKKNGRYPMKKYQAPGTKQVRYNARSPTGKTADCTKESVASGTSNEKGEKENVGNGSGVVDVENLTNFLKQTTDAQNLSYKITTIEVIGKGNNDHTVENDIENEKAKENEEPVEYKNVAKSPVPPVKSSRIPRAKIVALPIQTVQEFRSGKKTTASIKLKDCTNVKCPPGCDQNNVDIPDKEATTVQSDRVQDETMNEQVHFEKTVKDTKIVWDEKTSETEAEGDRALSSTEEYAPVIDGLNHPQVLSILQNLKLNCPCKTCTNQNLPSSSRPDDDSDLKSSSPEEFKKKKWPLRHRKYIDTSSEGISSDRYNDKERRKKRSKNNTVKNPLILREKTSSLINANPKASGRRGSNSSFFNTLFDIVFWPYVFLKSNR